MKLLCSSNSVGFAQSLRIALEGEGIETFCSEPDLVLSSIAGPIGGGAGRVYVLHDEDWPRAVEILDSLAPPRSKPQPVAEPPRRFPRWFVVCMVAIGAALLVAVLGSG